MVGKVTYTMIGDRKIIIKGVGKLFYQMGFPISMSILKAKEMGSEVSILHVAKECLKHGWSESTVLRKLKEEFADDPNKTKYNAEELEKFLYSSYDEQREMIFQYLFECSTDDVRSGINTKPLEWAKNYIANE